MTSELARIERSYPLPGSYPRCLGFFFEAIRRLGPAVPEVAQDALVTAKSYWLEGNRNASLMTAKAQLWREVDRVKGGVDASMESILRCVLFVLEPAPSTSDVHELLGWFVEFMTGAGFREPETLSLLTESFPLAE